MQHLISYRLRTKIHNLVFVFILLTSSAFGKVGEVSFQTQQAQISRGADKILTEVGTGVEMDDEIETLDGTVRIIFLDETKVTISEYSSLYIDEFVYDNSSNKGKVNLKASLGTLRYTSGLIANKENIKITTPTASVSVRGTDFEVTVSETGKSKFTLLPSIDSSGNQYTGSIEISNAIGKVILTEAFQVSTVTSSFNAPSTPTIDNSRRIQNILDNIDEKNENEETNDEEVDRQNNDAELFEEAFLIEASEENKGIFVIEDNKATFISDDQNKVKLVVPSDSDVSLKYDNRGAITEGTLNAGGSISINIIQQ